MGLLTQQDPIGIAGGLNLYGYANGDPVNFSDPFGLCPWPPSSCFQNLANWGARQGGAAGWLALNGGALGAGLFEASAGADAENAVTAAGDGRFLAAAGSLAMATPAGRGLKAFKPGKWLSHFMKHGDNLSVSTSVEYLEAANGLFRGGDGVQTFTRANGDELFYREATNEFGVLNSDGVIRTYFSPDEGLDYWISQTGGG